MLDYLIENIFVFLLHFGILLGGQKTPSVIVYLSLSEPTATPPLLCAWGSRGGHLLTGTICTWCSYVFAGWLYILPMAHWPIVHFEKSINIVTQECIVNCIPEYPMEGSAQHPTPPPPPQNKRKSKFWPRKPTTFLTGIHNRGKTSLQEDFEIKYIAPVMLLLQNE